MGGRRKPVHEDEHVHHEQEGDEHEDMSHLHMLPHRVRKRVEKHYRGIATHNDHIKHLDHKIDQHLHSIEQFHAGRQSRHHLKGLFMRAMGKGAHHPEHKIDHDHPHVKKIQRKILKLKEQIKHHNNAIMDHHVHIDGMVHKYSKRHDLKQHIRRALGLHASLDVLPTIEEDTSMGAPQERLVAAEIITARLNLHDLENKLNDGNPNLGSGHRRLETPEAVVKHLMTHFEGAVKCNPIDETCAAIVDVGSVPAMMNYLQAKGWRVVLQTADTISYKHPNREIHLILDYKGEDAGYFWCY